MAIKNIVLNNKRFNISYDIINNDMTNSIVFLHGWGSNKDIMQQSFGTILNNYRHIYIDMPGFGKSSCDYIMNTVDYVNAIKIFLEELQLNIDTIVGHSFGGKIATLLNPSKLILLSSAGIIEEKSFQTLLTIRVAKVFNRFGLSKVTKLLRSSDVDNMSQNMYETFKNVVDEDFTTQFKSYKNSALILWGKDDKSTSLDSGKKIASLIKNSFFHVLDGDHYFFVNNKKEVDNYIKGFIDGNN